MSTNLHLSISIHISNSILSILDTLVLNYIVYGPLKSRRHKIRLFKFCSFPLLLNCFCNLLKHLHYLHYLQDLYKVIHYVLLHIRFCQRLLKFRAYFHRHFFTHHLQKRSRSKCYSSLFLKGVDQLLVYCSKLKRNLLPFLTL